MNKLLRRILCLLLTLVLLLEAAPVLRAGAAQISLPEIQIGEDILSNDLFYLASVSATLNEGMNETYLLRVGRGGAAEDRASVTVKISDMTARYGTDYTVSVLNSSEKATVPENNFSLMDLFGSTEYEQTELKDEAEAEALIEDDEEGKVGAELAIRSALDFLADASGIDASDGAEELDDVQKARNLFTGVDGINQHVTADSDVFRQMQDIADVMTSVVPGASLKLTFGPGETEKYLVIAPKNNREGDGDRLFYVILSETEGSTTNSAASSCALTIKDDEEQTPSVMRFSQETYTEIADGMLTVTVEREGALNSNASVTVKTVGGTATAGRDYAEVDRELFFPFGIASLDVQIPVRTEFLTDQADFGLKLVPGAACTAEGEARAILTGTANEAAATDSAVPLRDEPSVSNNLLSLRTFDELAVDISNPADFGVGSHTNDFSGHNQYNSQKKAWEMDYCEDSGLFDTSYMGTVNAVWKLGNDTVWRSPEWGQGDDAIWIGGARIDLETSSAHGKGDHHSTIQLMMSYSKWGTFYEYCPYPSYMSSNAFGRTTVDIYPDPKHAYLTPYTWSGSQGMTPYVWIGNHGECSDCNWLWVYSITPLKRPFVARLIEAEPMMFLNEDGTYSADTKTAVAASIQDSVKGTLVGFIDDSVTVLQPPGENVTRYSRLTGLEYVPGGWNTADKVLIAVNTTLSSPSVTLKLTKENLRTMFNKRGSQFLLNENLLNWYRDGENKDFYDSSCSWNTPTYGDLALRPTFEYIDAKVTLQNPYDVPVCFTVSGTEYWIAPKDSCEIPGIHVGDRLVVSDIRVGPGFETNYKRAGVRYWHNTTTGDLVDGGSKPFYNGQAINFGSEKNNRLVYQELVISPEFSEKDNQIVVRVKTTDVAKFKKEGIFAGTGKVNGAYTEYIAADSDHTIPGRTYPLIATPVNDKYVSVWTVSNGTRYVGSSFLFEGGRANAPDENVIQLSLVAGASDLRLTGTLTYTDYNLSSLDTGGASTRPASGAAVVAGTMIGTTDEDGKLTTTTMRIPARPQLYRVRCMISANGSSVVRDLSLPSRGSTLDITQTFNTGLSPVLSPIFRSVRVECDRAQASGLIPLSKKGGEKMKFKVFVSPAVYTSQIPDGNGNFTNKLFYEKPLSVQIVTVDETGRERYAWDVVTKASIDTSSGEYEFDCEIPYVLRVMDILPPKDPEEAPDETVLFSAEPGDSFYLRLTTDLLNEVADLGLPAEMISQLNAIDEANPVTVTQIKHFTYSDVFTGMKIYAPPEYVIPVKQGLQTPIDINFANFDLLGDVGMNLSFPVVNIGYMPTDRGYRIYIGVSPLQIANKIKGVESPLTHFRSDDGTAYGGLFSMAHPFASFAEGMGTALNTIGMYRDGVKDVSSLGASQWRFDFTLGVYFDFEYCTLTDQFGRIVTDYNFCGIGGYVSITVGFRKAWYTLIPVVFIPAYLGIQIEATVMGFFGVARQGTPPEIITFEDATKKPGIKFEGQFNDEFNWCIMATGMFQLSVGVGICGILGLRVAGEVDVIANYEPSKVEGIRDWGCFLDFKAGLIIDLFIASIPLMYSFYHMKFGKFEDFDNKPTRDVEPVQSVGSFHYSTGNAQASEWLGKSTVKRGAFTPKQTYTLAENSYEHADSQLITLKNGTAVLAYLSNDPDKGVYQRTTLMLTTYKNGVWTEPVAVSNDGTADFQPSIAETKDGRVLIAWVSSDAADLTEETPVVDYLRSMEIFAAFAEIGENGEITVGETQQISKDQYWKEGEAQPRHYYDANPTVICDDESGDAIIYYIKSANATADPATLANPYVNDSVVCYLPWDEAKGKWMTDEFYYDELDTDDPDELQFLIDNFCGQRFLYGPTFETEEGELKYYSIPDFTAIGGNGRAIYAYTVDRDSSNETDADKEMVLQVYSFKDHFTRYPIRLTDDLLPDAMPQLFRATNADQEEGDAAHTKLFWYRDGSVCYLDITALLRDGVNEDGTLKPKDDGSGTCAVPIMINASGEDFTQSNQMANFRVAEDAEGRTYLIWTHVVNREDSLVGAQEIFAMGYYAGDEDNSARWSKPYQLTNTGLQNDEVVLTLVGEDLLLVHNRYQMELNEDEDEPLKLTDMCLAATTLAPCGSVVTKSITVNPAEEKTSDLGAVMHTPSGLLQAGDGMTVMLKIENNGLNAAEGYHVDVYAVRGETEEAIWSYDADTRLLPNDSEELCFEWKLPEVFDGLYLKAVTRENNYSDRFSYTTEPFEYRANFSFSEINTYQAADGFHLSAVLTNNGNAPASENEELSVVLSGPYDLDEAFDSDQRILCRQQVPALAIGESRKLDVVLDVPAQMMAQYGRIEALVCVDQEEPVADPALYETTRKARSEYELAELKLTRPMNFKLWSGSDLTLPIGAQKPLRATMELADLLGGDDVTYSVADPNIARIEDGVLIAAAPGETTVYAVHTPTGATVSVKLTVTGSDDPCAGYDDIERDSWYHEAADFVIENGIMGSTSTEELHFEPMTKVSRAMVASILYRICGAPEEVAYTGAFTDVAEGEWYANAVEWCAQNGLASGKGDGLFDPNGLVTRQELAVFMNKLAEYQARSLDAAADLSGFPDANEIPAWAETALKWAVGEGLISGKGREDGTVLLAPTDTAMRCELASILLRFLAPT